MSFIKRLMNKVPKRLNNVWYNQIIWISEREYPIIHDTHKNYIRCKLGLKVLMGRTKSKECIYYEVVKLWRTNGSDYLYPSDAINCNLKFSHFSKPEQP